MGGDPDRLIQHAITTFEGELAQLMREHAGKWVAYRGPERIDCAASKDALLQFCYSRGYDDKELFVAKVQADAPEEVVIWED